MKRTLCTIGIVTLSALLIVLWLTYELLELVMRLLDIPVDKLKDIKESV